MNNTVSYTVTIDFAPVMREEGVSSARFREMASEATRAELATLSRVATQIFRAVADQLDRLEAASMPLGLPVCTIQITTQDSCSPSLFATYADQLERLVNRCVGFAMIESDVHIAVQFARAEVLQ